MGVWGAAAVMGKVWVPGGNSCEEEGVGFRGGDSSSEEEGVSSRGQQ